MTPQVDGALLKARDIVKSFDSRRVLDQVCLDVSPGEVVVLIGPNGAGKSTLLDVVLGLRDLDGGKVTWLDIDPKREIGVQLQSPPVFPGVSVTDNIRLVCALYGCFSHVDIPSLLSQCGITELANRRSDRLSGGERKRMSIAMALAVSPKLIVLDEPGAALDPGGQEEVRVLIRRFADQGRAVVVATHDMREAEDLATRLFVIDRGKVLAAGAPRALLEEHNVSSVAELYLSLTAKEAS